MKEILISRLRDKNTSIADFREATEKLGFLLAGEVFSFLKQNSYVLKTPLSQTEGVELSRPTTLVPILRSGFALLPPFLKFFPKARVGFVGMRRDEKTAEPHQYYHNLPHLLKEEDVLILEPMIATGGSGLACIRQLLEAGAKEEQILFIGIIAAPIGIKVINDCFPKVKIHIAQIDQKLNAQKFILPGLGDFGDRYFGTG